MEILSPSKREPPGTPEHTPRPHTLGLTLGTCVMAPAVFGRKEVTARRGRDTGSFGHTDSERKSPLPPRKSRDAAFLHILVAISQCFGHACDFRWVTGLHLVTGWGHCLAIPPTDESIAPSGCTLHGDTEHTPHSRSHGKRSHVPFTRAV